MQYAACKIFNIWKPFISWVGGFEPYLIANPEENLSHIMTSQKCHNITSYRLYNIYIFKASLE